MHSLLTLLSEKSVTHAPPLGNLLAIQISAIGIGRWISFLFSFSCSTGGCQTTDSAIFMPDIVHDFFSSHNTLIIRVACPLTHSLIAYPLCSIVQALSSSLEFFFGFEAKALTHKSERKKFGTPAGSHRLFEALTAQSGHALAIRVTRERPSAE